MILKDKRQVVIINDIRSDKIEQAIFILRDKNDKGEYESKNNSDLVIEAHRIINSFLYPGTYARRRRHKNMAVQGIMWLVSLAAVAGISVMLIRLAAPF